MKTTSTKTVTLADIRNMRAAGTLKVAVQPEKPTWRERMARKEDAINRDIQDAQALREMLKAQRLEQGYNW